VVLDLCQQHEIPYAVRDIMLAEVYSADEIFCSGTMGELVPVLEVDGRSIGTGQPGAVYARLAELFEELTKREGVVVVEKSA
jgi:branched-chain amino acid aminotransferase